MGGGRKSKKDYDKGKESTTCFARRNEWRVITWIVFPLGDYKKRGKKRKEQEEEVTYDECGPDGTEAGQCH